MVYFQRFSFICLCFVLQRVYIKCIGKPLQCQQGWHSCFWSVMYNTTAKLLCFSISKPAGPSYVFFSSHIMFVFTFWDFFCQERFMICLMWSHNKKCSIIFGMWLWEKHSPHLVCICSLFHLQWTVLFESISSLLCLIVWITVVNHLKRMASPSFAKKKKNTTHFKSLQLSALYIDIYLFFGRKKKTVYDLRWRGTNMRLILHRWGELMVFIHFIFDTLCTLIHADADTQLLLRFTLHWFSRETSITLASLSNTELPERERERGGMFSELW